MKSLIIITLLTIFPAYTQASIDWKRHKEVERNLIKLVAKQVEEPKEIKIIINKDTKFFLDGKRIDKMPPPDNVVIEEIVNGDDGFVKELYFRTEK